MPSSDRQAAQTDAPRVAIMQPTYVPWMGYFALMARVDAFVFFDDVQFVRHGFGQRNRILVNGQVTTLSVPVRRAGFRRSFADAEIDYTATWQQRHVRLLQRAYAEHPFYRSIAPVVEAIGAARYASLAELNESLIALLREILGIRAGLSRAKDFELAGARTDRVIAVCKHVNASECVVPVASTEYLLPDRFEERSGVRLRAYTYEPQAYPQRHSKRFVGHLSVLDAIANVGPNETLRMIGATP